MREPRGWVALVSAALLVLLAPLTTTAPGARAAGDGAAATGRRPNVLLIVSDDQAWSTFSRKLMPSVYSQLVDRGVVFRRAYVNTSLCCPSRAQIVTGLYEHDTGVDANNTPLTRPTFIEALNDVGYRTMLAGKYMNSWPCNPRPEFDRWVCVGNPKPSTYSLVDPYMNVDGEWQRFSGYQTDILATMASNFIADTPKDQPFFVMYSPTTPHIPADDPRYDAMPVTPPRGPTFDANTMTPGTPQFARRPGLLPSEIAESDQKYTDMAQSTRAFDDSIGSLLSSLGDRSRDTLVVYLSDNGFLYGEHRRFGKTDPWEESVRVPMVVRYPAVLPEDQAFASDALVQNVDIAPTVAALAGLPWGADGRSFLPILERKRTAVRTAALIENCRGVSQGSVACSGLRYEGGKADAPGFEGIVTRRYKYVELDDGSVQLIDLKRDPNELRNLALDSRRSGLRRSLATRLHALMRPRLQTTIATGPGRSLSARVAAFTFFSPSRFATYRCRLTRDGGAGPWRSCPEGSAAFGDLADGRYVFEVAGVDEQGGVDPTPASRAFTVTTAGGPDVTLVSKPPSAQTASTASFAYSSTTPGAQFVCKLVPVGPVSCDASGVGLTGLTEGDYRFEVWARDPQTGATSDPGVGWDFRVDTTGPTMAFSEAPARSTTERAASFRFAPLEVTVGRIVCEVDGRRVGCARGRVRLPAVSNGSHQLAVKARDTLGNVGTTTYRWRVDRAGPVVTITDGPPRRTSGTNASFFLSSSETPGLFVCKLDDLPVMPCFQSQIINGLRPGEHTFTVWSVDAAMNRSAAEIYRWTVT